ncbi:Mucin-21 [Xylographa pallens]|nr:Mucin-21 [Xylographa pallens]
MSRVLHDGSAFQLSGETAPLFFSTDPSATPGPGSNPTLQSGAAASLTSNAPSTVTSKTSPITPTSTTTTISTSTSSTSTASSTANSQLTFTEYTTVQPSTTAVASNVLPPAGVTSATGALAGGSTPSTSAIASKAGSWNLRVQRKFGYLAGIAAGLGLWLV